MKSQIQLFCWQEAKTSKLLEIALLKSKEKQFAAPPRKELEQRVSWTLLPPTHTHSASPKKIGVLLQGQFYVYKADRALVKKVNEKLSAGYKAGS